VGVAVGVGVEVGVGVGLVVGVGVGVAVGLGVPIGLAVGADDPVGDAVGDAVPLGVPLPVGVGVPLGAPLPVGVGVALGMPDGLALGVPEPGVDGVGVGRTTMALPPLVLHAETERDATTVSVHKMGATGCREIATSPPLEKKPSRARNASRPGAYLVTKSCPCGLTELSATPGLSVCARTADGPKRPRRELSYAYAD